MTKETVFELIRREDVVLWAGAGLSVYAGYPTGWGLSKKLIELLNPSEKRLIYNKNAPLQELTEEIVRLKGESRNFLITELKNVFLKAPSSTTYHDLLSQIPHIRTIITTNYDNLFEKAYGSKIQRIVTNQDVAYINSKERELFKIHGDLSNPDSIIITKSDYKRFYANKNDTLLWNVITERISNKTVLFIGYGFEDTNVEILFDNVSEILKTNKKPAYLIAPKLPPHKVSHLRSQGITYLNLKAEVFIKKLMADIQDKIMRDMDKGFVKVETFRDFVGNWDILPELQAKEDNTFKVKSLINKKGGNQGTINFSIKKNNKNLDQFLDFVNGKSFGEIKLPPGSLSHIDFTLNNINLLPSDKGLEITFQSIPKLEGNADLLFDDGFVLRSIDFKVFGSPKLIQIFATGRSSKITVNYALVDNPRNQVDFHYEQTENFHSVADAIDVYSFLLRFIKAEPFEIYNNGTKETTRMENYPTAVLPVVDYYLEYYNLLKDVETKYKVRFKSINYPTEEDYDSVNYALLYHGGKESLLTVDAVVVVDVFEHVSKKDLVERVDRGDSFKAAKNEIEYLTIHGQKVKLGYQVIEVYSPIIINKEEFLEGKTTVIKIRSGNKKIKTYYTDTEET